MVMPQPVPAPLAGPPRFGLLVAANVVRDTIRWEQGYVFTPEACTGRGGVFDPCGSTAFDAERGRPSDVTNTPFGVWEADLCSVDSEAAEDGRARARRALEANESAHIASEFWLGTLSTAEAWDNQHLAAGGDVTALGAALQPRRAMGVLEQGLATLQGNRRGMIHTTPDVLSRWAADSVVRRDGNLWLTPHDHIVVTDAGYPGSGPAGQAKAAAATWAYVTGLVTVRLGPVEVIPSTDDLPSAISHRINDATFYALRLASPSWDGCALGAASIDLTAA